MQDGGGPGSIALAPGPPLSPAVQAHSVAADPSCGCGRSSSARAARKRWRARASIVYRAAAGSRPPRASSMATAARFRPSGRQPAGCREGEGWEALGQVRRGRRAAAAQPTARNRSLEQCEPTHAPRAVCCCPRPGPPACTAPASLTLGDGAAGAGQGGHDQRQGCDVHRQEAMEAQLHRGAVLWRFVSGRAGRHARCAPGRRAEKWHTVRRRLLARMRQARALLVPSRSACIKRENHQLTWKPMGKSASASAPVPRSSHSRCSRGAPGSTRSSVASSTRRSSQACASSSRASSASRYCRYLRWARQERGRAEGLTG